MTLSDAEKSARLAASCNVERAGSLIGNWQIEKGGWLLEFELPDSAPGWSYYIAVKPSGDVDKMSIAPASKYLLRHT